jgi:hypothetical protein
LAALKPTKVILWVFLWEVGFKVEELKRQEKWGSEKQEEEEEKEYYEKRLSKEQEAFIETNSFRIDRFIASGICHIICHNYRTTVKQHSLELKSELYFALRKVAYHCNNLEYAYISYIPETFKQTVEEYFIEPIRDEKRLVKYLKTRIIPEHRPFKLLNCPKVRRLLRKAKLTIHQRKAFIFRNRGLKLTFKQISIKLNCNERNTKKHYYRALELIKDYVKRTSLEIDDIYRTPTEEEYAKL